MDPVIVAKSVAKTYNDPRANIAQAAVEARVGE